jgi:nitric oxide reductase large subunit
MINPPIALFYMQGLNTTRVHGHAALFGVYGSETERKRPREISA